MADFPIPPVNPNFLTTARSETAPRPANEAEAAKEFEAVFLSQFVDEMMKTVDMGPASGGQAGEMWRSFMSQALADSLVERGGLGFAENIERKLAAYRPKE